MLTELERQIRKEIISIIKSGDEQTTNIRYKALADKFQLPYEYTNERNDFHKLLDDINRYEVEQKRPLLSVVVVNATGMPGRGFFRLARELGKQKPDIDNDTFAVRERKELFDYWKNNNDPDR
jgi:hypothetical protein